ncbi:MAG: hypothetical protein KUG58_02185, partial [Marinosulfonomonas sp.]|nr:hypothetical protein [Marinosulfonomonas sp.]
HEGDTLHFLQIVLRMADGQWPHLDFMTPIGVLAVAPISMFVALGYGAGTAILLSQLLVAVILLPAVWWAAYSRMRGVLPYLFGFIVLVLVTALVYGETEPSISISMHYNRWAWAISFVAIALAVIPSKLPPRQGLDGVLIGLAMAALLLMKVTYFVAFAAPIVVAMLMRRNFRMFLVSVATGVVVMGVLTLLAGVGFWQAYLGDLLTVSQSGIRPEPSANIRATITGPAHMAGSVALIFAVVMLRNARDAIGGVVLMLLVPGFFYVTYQNFANDPQWLLMLGVILLSFSPERGLKNAFGWDMRTALKVNAAIVLALAAPSFLNLTFSPLRHYYLDAETYSQLLPQSTVHTDLNVASLRAYRVDARIAFAEKEAGLDAYSELADRDAPVVLNGETLTQCEIELGLPIWFQTIVSDLDQAGLAKGKRIFAADLFSSHWLFGPLLPLEQGAPWYYGGLPGIQSADYVLVPVCSVIPDLTRQILDAIDTAGITLTEVRRTPLYILLEPDFAPASAAQQSTDN